jgi:UDP:flavonoid glycosyltransferase YjiC (YdhE family)
MRILFIPNRGGPISHGVPLLALSDLLHSAKFTKAFLIPQHMHGFFKMAGAEVVGMHHDGVRTEIMAYNRFKPDIVVDDFSLSTAVASTLVKLPRVTIQRTGTFPNSLPNNPSHRHSGNLDLSSFMDFAKLGLPQPRSLADLAQGDAIIVPGISSLEPLPVSVHGDHKYFYAGPLLIKDYFSKRSGHFSQSLGEVEQFFREHASMKVVYVTLGNIVQPHALLQASIRSLSEVGLPIISNVSLQRMDQKHYFYAPYLPNHYICSRVALVVHHCGSGTYHYPILHQTPFITVGTGTYDRDDVAIRLRDAGAGCYIPSPEECEDFQHRFVREVMSHLSANAQEMASRRLALRELKDEIVRTSESFNFEEVINFALSAKRSHH